MIPLWSRLEGASLASNYRLQHCLIANPDDAWYVARLDDGTPAAVRVMSGDPPATARLRLEGWRAAISLDHPNLARLLDAGQSQVFGHPLIFAVAEFPDDFLSSSLAERPLTHAETLQLLESAISALVFLHRRGYVHTAVDPEHLLAFGSSIKLPLDTIVRPSRQFHPVPSDQPNPYQAPELADGILSPAADLWSLGITLHYALTQHLPTDDDFRYLAPPFNELLPHLLDPDPTTRWTAAGVEAHLHPSIPVRTFPIRLVPVAGLAAGLIFGAIFLRPSLRHPHVAAPPVVHAAPARVAKPAPPVAVPEQTAAADWRVVAYVCGSRSDAEKELHGLKRSHNSWRPDIVAPHGRDAPFYVTIGDGLSRAQAERLKKKARDKGLPRDIFVRSFP